MNSLFGEILKIKESNPDSKECNSLCGMFVYPTNIENRKDITNFVLTAYDNSGKVIWAPQISSKGNILDNSIDNKKLQNSSFNIIAGQGIKNAGSISLGGTVSINVDNTVIRNTGEQNLLGIVKFKNETNSTNSSTGAVIIDGGLGIKKDTISESSIRAKSLTDGILSISLGSLNNTKELHFQNSPSPPKKGGVIYVENGILKYKGDKGTITTLGVA